MGRTKRVTGVPTPSQAPTRHCIAFATARLPANAISGKTMTQVKSEINLRGDAIVNSTDQASGCTHLIVTEAQFSKRGPIVTEALANNDVHIVSFDWLEAVLSSHTPVDETQYLIHDRKVMSNGSAASTNVASKPLVNLKRRKDAEDDEDDNKTPTVATKKTKSEAAEEDVKAGSQQTKTASLTIPLDEGIDDSSYKVYVSDDSIVYDVTLNQTNAGANNNKFYRIQLLESPDGFHSCWTRWGRVGEFGQKKMLGPGNLASAMSDFNKKFKDKNGNTWDNRFEAPKKGKYTFIERNYEESDNEDAAEPSPKKRRTTKEEDTSDEPVVESKLSEPIQSLMKLIFNQDLFASTFASLNYDAEKMPLGKLSKRTLLQGYEVLKDLAAMAGQFGTAIEDKSNQYFSLIPHAFGRSRPPVLNNMADIKREIEVLETLTDMQLATDIMKQAKGGKNPEAEKLHLLDRQYLGLGMQEMTPLEPNGTEFKELAAYLVKSGGHTHNLGYKVQDIFRIERQGEHARFNGSKFVGMKNTDRRLLWHGSRCTNFGGILSQGLRIAPPEAPVNGYMFGKGVYLADMSSKSANYCCSYSSGGQALLLLCEAELGKPPLKLTDADYNAGERAITAGAVSTWGVGRTAPLGWKDAGVVHKDLQGVQIPDVEKKPPGATNEPNARLQYNEFIVYDVAQIRLRYLFRVQIG